jgi:PKD repeat protein
MKKLIFTLLATFTLFILTAQVDRELVLVEIGTGTWCYYCPGAAMGANDLMENGDPVAVVEYHNGDVFTTTESNARNSYYGITGYPTAHFDGEYTHVIGGSNTQTMYGTYLPIVNARMQMQTAFTLEITGDNTDDDYSVTIKANKIAAYSGTNLVVHLALTETDIPYTWFGMTTCDFVERLMVPGSSGTPVTFPSNNSSVEVDLNFTFNNTWVKENCELIAWVQDNSNKYVLHTASVMLNDLDPGVPTYVADFFAEDTDLCGPGTGHFNDLSIGNVIQYAWTFEGGNPATSSLMNPNVYYSETGEYDVQLIIFDGSLRDTAFKEDYMKIHELPDVEFAAVEDLCNEDWDPYTLTQGSPEGGVYTGEYVSDGMYFHPTASGVGEFVVTYTYADEFGCENSDDQVITVVNCVGVGENSELVSLEIYPNPTTGKFNLNINADELNNAELKVIDIVGKVIFEQNELNVQGSQTLSIDIGTHPSGIYFVQIKNDEQSISKKVFLK